MTDTPRGRGFGKLTPELCRKARHALWLRYEAIGAEAGVRPAAVMKYELGKPTDEEIVEKLRAFFETHNLIAIERGRDAGKVVRYIPDLRTWEDEEEE